MERAFRPHVLGLDDGPFRKGVDATVPVVGVMMEGPDVVEAVAVTHFPVDGDAAADFLADWVAGLRFGPTLHGVVLGGITIAGLGVVDVERLSSRLALPVLVVNRHAPEDAPLARALRAAGLDERIEIVVRTPEGWRVEDGVYVAVAGADRRRAETLLANCRGKSQLPEPLRVAHLVAAALVTGQSRGRV